MKPITRDDCELMWVWDGGEMMPPENQRKKLPVAILLPDGMCCTLDIGGNNLIFWRHCAPIEKEKVKKWVLCECREDLPEGFFDGWVRNKISLTIFRVNGFSEDKNEVYISYYPSIPIRALFGAYEWSPTFDGPYQPIGKLVEVE